MSSDFKNLPDYVLFELIDRMDMDTLINVWKADKFMRGRINFLGKEQLAQLRENTTLEDIWGLYDIVTRNRLLPALLILILTENKIRNGRFRWRTGLQNAAYGGYLDLVEWFTEKGAPNRRSAIKYAAQGGHFDLVKYFMEKDGVDQTVLNDAMSFAAIGGHFDLVKYFMEKGVKGQDALIWGIHGADLGGHQHIVDYLKNMKDKCGS